MNRDRLPLALLLIGLFWSIIAGGHIVTDQQTVLPGTSLAGLLSGSADSPLLGQFFGALLIGLGCILALLQRKVVQIPFPKVFFTFFSVLLLIIGSGAFSEFKSNTLVALSQWSVMFVAFYAVIAIAGRGIGVLLVATSIVAASTVLAMLGLIEYLGNPDPNWRVFCNYVNPNAAAGALIPGLVLGLGVFPAAHRLWKLPLVVAMVLISVALFLTGSKGGLLAAGAGLIAFYFVLSISRVKLNSLAPSFAIGIAVLAAGFFGSQTLIKSSADTETAAPAAVAGRLATSGETQEQSMGYRVLLWKGAIELMKSNPIGSGTGTYRYESSRSGLTPQTINAHQGFLQLGVESGLLALGGFLVALGLWSREMLRRQQSEDALQKMLRSCVVGAVAGMAAHNCIDSDLQVFGTGVAFFAVLGLGLLAAIDGVTPEFFPRSFRSVAATSIGVIILLFAFVLQIDFGKSRARGAIATNDLTSATAQIESISGRGAYDHDVAALQADIATNPNDLLSSLKRATELGPSMRNYRRLARFYMQSGDYPRAVTALQSALQRDPNNLLALRQLMELHIQQQAFVEAEEVARRLVNVEKSPYYTVRAIPEAVPTETLRARIFLAGRVSEPSEKAELLGGALRGFIQYVERTIPKVVQMGKVTPPMKFAGEGVEEAKDALIQGAKALAELRKVASASKDPDVQSLLDRAAIAFAAGEEALASLSK